MTDRELLELAAKAAGYNYRIETCGNDYQILANGGLWNPLTDDGDALRLAVMLNMFDNRRLFFYRSEETRSNPSRSDIEIFRRAVVRTAAELGKRMNHD